MVLLFYTTYISVDLAYHELFHVKVGKSGIMILSEELIGWSPEVNGDRRYS